MGESDGEHSTHLPWAQAFECVELADQLRDFVTAANEQNLNRLAAVLRGT